MHHGIPGTGGARHAGIVGAGAPQNVAAMTAPRTAQLADAFAVAGRWRFRQFPIYQYRVWVLPLRLEGVTAASRVFIRSISPIEAVRNWCRGLD